MANRNIDEVINSGLYDSTDFYESNNNQENIKVDNFETKINWKAKLSSRKFWALIVGFITPLFLAFGLSQNIVNQVAAIIMSGGAIVAYMFAESNVDKNRQQEIEINPDIEILQGEDDGQKTSW